jgi:hypothetical protein
VEALLEAQAQEAAAVRLPFADPVFVLCNARSGSTLLRFLLDAHPELACPPETNLPVLCGQLATVWSLIEGAPLSQNRGDEPPNIPDAAITGVKETMDRMVGSYLDRKGKKRYCDKSLGTARLADLLLRVYPEAQFICLYRHPADVIASGMEACPWGLNGYGFDGYIASTPGNAVLAMARFWADNTALTMAAEEKYPDRCVRVRYEDLVTDPEATAERVFQFLGAAAAPGISQACFSEERERFGPGDHKIWYTGEVSPQSVGRGWSIPTALIGPQLLATMRELTDKLGYVPMDDDWGTSARPADLRLPPADPDAEPAGPDADSVAPDTAAGLAEAGAGTVTVPPRDDQEPGHPEPVHSGELGLRLRAALAEVTDETRTRWDACATETLVAISVPADPRQPGEHWLIDLGSQTVTFTDSAAQETSDWDVIGTSDAWEQVMAGKLNLSAALRSCQLRYCDSEDSGGPVPAARRIGVLADLLGIAHWRADVPA